MTRDGHNAHPVSFLVLTFSPFPKYSLDLGRGGGLRPVEELSMSLLLGRVKLGERAEMKRRLST